MRFIRICRANLQWRLIQRHPRSCLSAYNDVFLSFKSNRGCMFTISPPRHGVTAPQPAGFLSVCHLCNKSLHGNVIYMYRGENAYCSVECRSWKIAMDERSDGSQASSSGI